MNNIKSARLAAGLTQAQMSEKMSIPKRTIENWEQGSRQCPEWAEKLIIKGLNNMITIITDEMQKFHDLPRHSKFIWRDSGYEWFAIKINDEYAAFINGEGKYIKAKAYKNILSIGSGFIVEYDNLQQVEDSIN